MKLIGFLFLFVLSTSLGAEKARFDFYRLFKVKIENELQLEVFKQISEYPDGYRFMAAPPSLVDSVIQFIVPPHKFAEWNDLVVKYALHVSLITNNLQDLFEKQENRNRTRRALERFDWTSFRTLEEIHAWLREQTANRPNDVSTFVVGTSYEGREMLGLRVNVGNVAGKKSIFFESLIHSPAWIGASSTTYIINELLTSTDAEIQDLLNTFDWWFLPVYNVDGYIYTWNVDRTWQKTRGPTRNILCRGTNINRNWDLHWATSGSSDNPCSIDYHGDAAFSEPETLQLAQFLQTVPNLFGYISFHSPGQLLMLPYAYSANLTADHELLMEIGQISLNELSKVRGTQYSIETINSFFGDIAGSSIDYVFQMQQPKFTYCYEINLDTIVMPEEIIPTAQEIFASVTTIFREAIARGLA